MSWKEHVEPGNERKVILNFILVVLPDGGVFGAL